jgi:hypothetical protein
MSSQKSLKNRGDEKNAQALTLYLYMDKKPRLPSSGVHWQIEIDITGFLSWML